MEISSVQLNEMLYHIIDKFCTFLRKSNKKLIIQVNPAIQIPDTKIIKIKIHSKNFKIVQHVLIQSFKG